MDGGEPASGFIRIAYEMKLDQVPEILTAIEAQLNGVMPPEAESAVRQLLNLVEQLVAEQRHLLVEVQRLQELLEQKKRSKTTGSGSAPPVVRFVRSFFRKATSQTGVSPTAARH